MSEHPEPRRGRFGRPLVIVGLVILGSAAIGFGGLAAWTVTTQNNGSQFTTGSVHHQNDAHLNGALLPVSCNDGTSPAACGLIFNWGPDAVPGDTVTGSVDITNTGTLQSSFTLTEASATDFNGFLCDDLTLTVIDNETAPATLYSGSLTAFPVGGVALNTAGTSPSLPNSASWNTTDTGSYSFTVTLPAPGVAGDMADRCLVSFLWTQVNT